MYAAGLFSTPVYDSEHHIQGCVAYPSSVKLGPSIKTAQAFGIMLVCFQTLIYLGLALVHFFVEWGTDVIYHIVRVMLPSAFCCQLLTFAAFASKFCSEVVDPMDEEGGTMPATCVPGGAGVVGSIACKWDGELGFDRKAFPIGVENSLIIRIAHCPNVFAIFVELCCCCCKLICERS